jgi:hypothetical protein
MSLQNLREISFLGYLISAHETWDQLHVAFIFLFSIIEKPGMSSQRENRTSYSGFYALRDKDQ